MKRSKLITLTILPALLALNACNSEDEVRDVYSSKDECLADWNDGDLCEQMGDDDAENYRRSGGIVYPYYIWGPRYYASDRSVIRGDRTFTPASSRSMSSPRMSSYSSGARTSGVSSPRSGGFGGRSFSGGS